jgi:intergrase/recombinase
MEKLKIASFHENNVKRSSSSWLGHKPSKMISFDLKAYREFLLSKYALEYAKIQFNYVRKYGDLIENPNELNNIPVSIRGNVLKSLLNLAKFLGQYESFRTKLKNYGIKWISTDNSFNSFLNIINNNHSNLGQWYSKALNVLSDNEKLYLKFVLLSGLRKDEAIKSMKLIQKLARENKLNEYWNTEIGILEHFKYGDLFLRNTKNCYISMIPEELVQQMANSKPICYTTLRKHLEKNKLTLRIKELRSYFATYLRKNGIISEYIDLIQGRIPRSVFARHYLKVDDLKALVSQVLAVTAKLEESLTE